MKGTTTETGKVGTSQQRSSPHTTPLAVTTALLVVVVAAVTAALVLVTVAIVTSKL